jgi:hypothetical protein
VILNKDTPEYSNTAFILQLEAFFQELIDSGGRYKIKYLRLLIIGYSERPRFVKFCAKWRRIFDSYGIDVDFKHHSLKSLELERKDGDFMLSNTHVKWISAAAKTDDDHSFSIANLSSGEADTRTSKMCQG